MATIRDLAKKVRDDAKKNRESPENKARQERLSNATLSSNTAFTSAAKPQAELSKPAKITSDVSGEAWIRATPSQTVIPEKTVPEKTTTENKQGFLSRLTNTVKGGLKGSLATNTDAMGALYESGQNARDRQNQEYLADYKRSLDRAKRDLEAMQADNKLHPNTWSAGDLESQGYIVEDAQRKYDAMLKVVNGNVQQKAATASRDLSAAVQESSAKDIAKAKDGLGTAGQILVDAGASLTQMAGDAAVGVATGTSGTMLPFGLRALGGGTMQARQARADIEDQMLYGSAIAAKEILTEKMFNIALPFSKAYGGGALDDVVQSSIGKAVDKFAKTDAGKKLLGGGLTLATSALSEGAEEFIGDWLEWQLPRIYGGDVASAGETLTNSMYDFLVGAASGLMGDVSGKVASGTASGVQSQIATRQVGQAVKDATGNTQNTSLISEIQKGLAADEGSKARTLAQRAQKELDSKKTVSNKTLGNLAVENRKDLKSILENADAAVAEAARAELAATGNVSTQTIAKLRASAKVSPAASAQVQQTEVQAQVTQAENPGSTVLDAATTLFTQQGMKLKTAQEKAGIVQKLIAGEEVSVRDINKLNPTSKESQAIFTQLTGVQFPEGKVTQEQLYNLYRSAHDVASQAQTEAVAIDSAEGREAFPGINRVLDNSGQETPVNQMSEEQILEQAKTVRETANPEADARAAQALAQMRGEIAPDGNALLSFKEFSDFIKQQNPKATREETARLYDQYLKDNQTVEFRGQRLSHQQFMDMVRNAPRGSELTEAEAESLWAAEVDRQRGTGEEKYSVSESQRTRESEMNAAAEQARRAENEATAKWMRDVLRPVGVQDVVVEYGTMAKNENAYIDSNGILHFNGNRMSGANAMIWTLGHELVHHAEFRTGETGNVSEDIIGVFSKLNRAGALSGIAKTWMDNVDGRVSEIKKTYQSHEASLENGDPDKVTDAYCREELAGDLMRIAFTEDNLLMSLAGEKPSLLIRSKEALARLKAQMFGNEQIRATVDARKALDEMEKRFEKALSSEKAKKRIAVEKVGVDVDEKSESASPARYNLDTWEKSDYVSDRDTAAKELAKELEVSEEQAKAYIDAVNNIAKMIADDNVRLDYEASPGRSAFVGNAEYGGSIDFSTICKKRRLFTGTFEAVQNALPNTALTAEEILDLRKRMKDKGYEVSCGLCYVEGSRANMGQYTKQFIERYAATNPEYVPNMAEMNTPDGQEKIRREHPEVYEAYEYFMNHYGRLAPGDKAIFASQQKPKMYQMATAYDGEILKKFRNGKSVDEKNKNGGLRLQSFSDFEIIHLIDNMQVIMDMARVGLAGQAYTKVPDFAWALGGTGLKINLSLIAKDVDENGNLVLDEVEGMKRADAVSLRDRYSDNVGTIIVVFNDAQLKAAMADDFIDYIIPFHRSQWKSSQYEAMGLPANPTDYTNSQNESYIEARYTEKSDGSKKKERARNYMPNTYWDFNKTGKENAETYLKMCAKDGKRPKFSHLLEYNGDGSYSLPVDGSADGYWKLLIDFKMYNNNGVGVPQKPVTPNFNMEQAQRMLNEYTGGHSEFPVAQDVADAFVKDYKAAHPGARYSVEAKTDDRSQNYTYDALVSKPDITVTPVPLREVPTKGKRLDMSAVATEGLKNADTIFSAGRTQRYVYVPDLGANVGLPKAGAVHGLTGNKTNSGTMSTAEVTYALPDVLKNSIAVNELNSRTEADGEYSYVLFGFAEREDGKQYLVKSTVNHFADNRAAVKSVDIYDILKGLKARKTEGQPKGLTLRQRDSELNSSESSPELIGPGSENQTLLHNGSGIAEAELIGAVPETQVGVHNGSAFTISVSQLLDVVKENYPELLPDSVREHYGITEPEKAPGVRYSITPEFEQWYKENFGGEDLTDEQLQRRLEYAKQKESDILVSKQAAKTKQDVDQRYKDLTAWMMYHERKMREQRQTLKDRSKAVQQSMKADKKDALEKQAEIHKAELAVARDEKVKALKDKDLAWRIYSQQQARNAAADKAEALKTARKEANAEKAEAVRTAKEVERAKAEVQHDADMMAMKREAAKRLRVKEDAYQQKAEQRKENQKLKRNSAKQALRDSKLAAKKRAEAEVKQGAVDTIRKNPASRSAVEKLQERASQMRTLGRSAYRTFVNQAMDIDQFAKRQVEGTRASTLVTVLGGTNDTVSTIYTNGLVDRAGNTIGESMKDVFLCWDIKGKKVDQNKQALLQDYMLHQHNVDRMSFVDRARTRLEAFEQENPWLAQMDTKEFARLVAMTEAEIQSTGKQEAHDKAVQYARLLHEYDTAQNKPIFGDSDGNAVTADTSRKIVQQYLSENPWLEEKAQGIYDWWDKFMRTWAVGDSITETEYNTMRELYPHYVPTYRADKKGVGAANFVGANGASIGKAVKKAKGGMSEVLNIEDSFSNLVSKIVRLERTNELYMNMIDSAMLDDDDTFSDMIVFDWDWQDGQYGKTLEIGAILNGDLDARYDDAETAGLSKVGQDRKLTAWHNGRQYSAYVSEDLFKSIANVTGTVANDIEKNLVKLGNALTGPMKTAITGINPTFAVRNMSRDLPTAITNSISGIAFPKYWAQAAAEIAKNSENWQHFQALGGTNATYYNDQNGFVSIMEKGDGLASKLVSKMGAFNEVTEAQTRFAEYLATIDRLGDTYENRLLGIKNAAEVTVDFSRKGRAGKLINAWVPYWNPAVQGVDKVVRSVIDSPDGSAVWKQAARTVGRASMTTVLLEAILYAVLKGIGRYDDWEELDDRTKDTYYCIPYGKSNTFIKVPKNREWGAILGTPFMRLLEYANGRENPFENYIETSLEPNFLPGQILAPREGGGWQSDVIGFSQALDLQANKDFAGRTIVPYAYQQGSLTQQYDENTSGFSKKLGELLNFSPMQIDYIIKDYFGDFGDLVVAATSDAVRNGTESLPEKAADLLTSPFKTDNRYSNYTVSKYYDTLEKLERTVQDRKNQMEGDSYQDTVEYQTKSALDKLYGKKISELNKQVRNSTDPEERDKLKGQIAELAEQALSYYDDCMSGKVQNPVLDAQYASLPSTVAKELERLDGYSSDYRFKPAGTPSKSYTDPKNKNKEYVLTDEQKDKFKEIYQEQYAQTFAKVIGSSKYKSASDEKKANLLENARDDVLEDTKDEFFKWLKKTGAKSTAKKK